MNSRRGADAASQTGGNRVTGEKVVTSGCYASRRMSDRTWDYKQWIGDVALVGDLTGADAYWLYDALSGPSENRGELFRCERLANGKLLARLASDKAPGLLIDPDRLPDVLSYIEEEFMEGMDPESWYSMRQAELRD